MNTLIAIPQHGPGWIELELLHRRRLRRNRVERVRLAGVVLERRESPTPTTAIRIVDCPLCGERDVAHKGTCTLSVMSTGKVLRVIEIPTALEP